MTESASGEFGLGNVPDDLLYAEVRRRELASVDQHRLLTMEEAVAKANAIIASQSNMRSEKEWADAFYDIAILLRRVRPTDA